MTLRPLPVLKSPADYFPSQRCYQGRYFTSSLSFGQFYGKGNSKKRPRMGLKSRPAQLAPTLAPCLLLTENSWYRISEHFGTISAKSPFPTPVFLLLLTISLHRIHTLHQQ